MKPTLLVLAAGMGSRYGGLKQMDPVGPGGELIIDYSVFDAIRSGFGRVVFVIRGEMEAVFRESIGRRLEKQLPVGYACQDLQDLPSGFSVPSGRSKPWGTGHAVLAARALVREPFAVVNADDFYGWESYQSLGAFLTQSGDGAKPPQFAMAGFRLARTVSPHGSVSRGICMVDNKGCLLGIVERTRIEKLPRGGFVCLDNGADVPLTGNEVVSMNMWGFTPSVFEDLERHFTVFLKLRGEAEKSEFYLPAAVDAMISEKSAEVRVLPTAGKWFGVTYPGDKPEVVRGIRQLIQEGVYPEGLWQNERRT